MNIFWEGFDYAFDISWLYDNVMGEGVALGWGGVHAIKSWDIKSIAEAFQILFYFSRRHGEKSISDGYSYTLGYSVWGQK